MSFEKWMKVNFPERAESESWNGDQDGSVGFARAAYAAGVAEISESVQRYLDSIDTAGNCSCKGAHPETQLRRELRPKGNRK